MLFLPRSFIFAVVFAILWVTQADALCSNPACWMCNFIRQHGYQAWNDYLAGRWREPRSLELQATPSEAIDMMLAGLNLKPSDVLYDLGCGDGRILIRAIRQYGCRAGGIEIDPGVAEIARRNLQRAGCIGSRIVTGDARKFLLDRADAVTMYLSPELVSELSRKVKTDRIASYMHAVPGRESRTVKVGNGVVYFSRGPVSVGGVVPHEWHALTR